MVLSWEKYIEIEKRYQSILVKRECALLCILLGIMDVLLMMSIIGG